jgi:hypothetical protein
VYHVELRQFPHNFCRFNLTERELQETILDAWVRGEWVELGERKWSPHQANLKVLEGPQLPVDQLSMGRGWRNAARQGQDVTEQLLAARSTTGAARSDVKADARERRESSPARAARLDVAAASDASLAADSLGLEVLAKVREEPLPLAAIWRLARQRYPESRASDCLKLAEGAVDSLIRAGLAIVLVAREHGVAEPCASDEEVERALHTIESWSSDQNWASALLSKV